MSLADTLAPKRIVFTLCKNCISIQAIQRKHSRIPANWNHSNMFAIRCCLVHVSEMLWNTRMCIKTVNHIKILCILRCLLRQISSTSTTQNHHVNFVFPIRYLINLTNSCAIGQNRYLRWVSSCKNSNQLHVIILTERTRSPLARLP